MKQKDLLELITNYTVDEVLFYRKTKSNKLVEMTVTMQECFNNGKQIKLLLVDKTKTIQEKK